MSTVTERVDRCFPNVLPNIRKEELAAAASDSTPGWDSVAHVTLLASIAEEFGVDFEVDDFEELVSHRRIVDYLEKKFQDA